MVDHNINAALTDAEWHLQMAETTINDGAPRRITVGYCALALIRGTDALCWHYTGNRCESGSGHDLHIEFERLYNKHSLPEKYSKYKNTIRRWVKQEKSKAQYNGKSYSRQDRDKAIKQTRRYINKCVKQALQDDGVIETEK